MGRSSSPGPSRTGSRAGHQANLRASTSTRPTTKPLGARGKQHFRTRAPAGLAWPAGPSPPGSALAQAPSDSSSTQGLARAQGSARLEGMQGLQPSPPGEIIRSGKSLSDGRCEKGEGPAGAGGDGCPCSCTAKPLLHQLHPILHLCKAIPGTRKGPRDPLPPPKGEGAPSRSPHPGGAQSRLQSCCQPWLAPCPALFSSRDTQRHSWKPGTSRRNMIVLQQPLQKSGRARWQNGSWSRWSGLTHHSPGKRLCWGPLVPEHPGGKEM